MGKRQLHDNMTHLDLVMDHGNEGYQAYQLQTKAQRDQSREKSANESRILMQGSLMKRGDYLPVYRSRDLILSTNGLTWSADGKQRGYFSLLELGPHRLIVSGPAVANPYHGNQDWLRQNGLFLEVDTKNGATLRLKASDQ